MWGKFPNLPATKTASWEICITFSAGYKPAGRTGQSPIFLGSANAALMII